VSSWPRRARDVYIGRELISVKLLDDYFDVARSGPACGTVWLMHRPHPDSSHCRHSWRRKSLRCSLKVCSMLISGYERRIVYTKVVKIKVRISSLRGNVAV